jgi:hypothetical protein
LTVPVRRIRWTAATRVVPSHYPPIDLYERVSSDPAVRDALVAAEMLVNPRLRDEIGELRLVPVADRITGPGASWVMAPFAYLNPGGSRFSDGSYGVYYAGESLATAVAETAFHFARIAADSADGARYEMMRVLVGRFDAPLHDLAQLGDVERGPLLDPASYAASRPFAAALRDAGSNGVHYPSVRRPGGHCIAVFRPRVVGVPRQARHLGYDWDGTRVRRYFDYAEQRWVALDPVHSGA